MKKVILMLVAVLLLVFIPKKVFATPVVIPIIRAIIKESVKQGIKKSVKSTKKVPVKQGIKKSVKSTKKVPVKAKKVSNKTIPKKIVKKKNSSTKKDRRSFYFNEIKRVLKNGNGGAKNFKFKRITDKLVNNVIASLNSIKFSSRVWSKGRFKSIHYSLAYHWAKHRWSKNLTVKEYFEKSKKLYNQKVKLRKLKDGKKYKGYQLIIKNEKIVTFWKGNG